MFIIISVDIISKLDYMLATWELFLYVALLYLYITIRPQFLNHVVLPSYIQYVKKKIGSHILLFLSWQFCGDHPKKL